MGEYKIEKGIEITETRGRRAKCKYPFRKMSVGDSFLVPCNGDKGDRYRAQQEILQHTYRHHPGFGKFITRCVDDGVRCWRVQ